MKYLIAGTGGVGGSIAGFLSMAGKDVTCIARGAHLQSIQTNGLKLKSDLKGEHTLRIPVTTAEEFSGKADVIFVCVKGYSVDSIVELIKRAAHKDTVVIPILNVYGTGPAHTEASSGSHRSRRLHLYRRLRIRHRRNHPNGKNIPSGIWCSSRHGCEPGLLEAIQQDLQEAGIKVDLSPDINRDTFIKWSFISAMAVTGAYYDVPMGEVQKPGKIRNTFIGLSTESAALGKKLGVEFPEDPVSYNLKVIDKLDPESTASMQKDLARGHDSEIQGLLFDMIAAAEEQGIDIPTYRMVAEKFKKSNH